MSNAFTNFLSGPGPNQGTPILKDYQHAARLYVDNYYEHAPKFGFIYFIQFNINGDIEVDATFDKVKSEVGLLVKRIDLPKFTVATETLNQYNRKTVVQTKLTYNPISIDLHDDNSNLTHRLWTNYFKHYYADSTYGGPDNTPREFKDTKYGKPDYQYGLYNNKTADPFLDSIDIFVLHKGEFTQYTLINPMITNWDHDSVEQGESKVLKNKMSITYETVLYNQGTIVPGQTPGNWSARYYDKDPSPLTIGGNPTNAPQYERTTSAFDQPSANQVFGRASQLSTRFDQHGAPRIYGYTGSGNGGFNPLASITGIMANNYVNQNGFGKAKATGYNIASGALGAATANDPGKYADPQSYENQPGIFTLPGGVGINIFKGFNTSVTGQVRANPAALIFPKK